MHLSERSIVVILSNNVFSTEKQGLSAPTMSVQKPNAHTPAIFVNWELYISKSGSPSRTALSILQTKRDESVRSNKMKFYRTVSA
jgi:hypothetical protein